MTKHHPVIQVQGSRGAGFYRPQDGESAVRQRRRLRAMFGTIQSWAVHHGSVGTPRGYDDAANRNPRRPTVADRDGD